MAAVTDATIATIEAAVAVAMDLGDLDNSKMVDQEVAMWRRPVRAVDREDRVVVVSGAVDDQGSNRCMAIRVQSLF